MSEKDTVDSVPIHGIVIEQVDGIDMLSLKWSGPFRTGILNNMVELDSVLISDNEYLEPVKSLFTNHINFYMGTLKNGELCSRHHMDIVDFRGIKHLRDRCLVELADFRYAHKGDLVSTSCEGIAHKYNIGRAIETGEEMTRFCFELVEIQIGDCVYESWMCTSREVVSSEQMRPKWRR